MTRRRDVLAWLAGTALAPLAPAGLASAPDRSDRGKHGDAITLFLCGDVMTGRAIDQILPYQNDPRIYEPYIRDAREYIALAEQLNGPIPRPVSFDYIWGDALDELERMSPDARIINLETAVTTHDKYLPKGINYRMHPGNVGVLNAAGIDCCALANNHVLDWGEQGLAETLSVLHNAGIRTAGAGLDRARAKQPAIIPLPGSRRVLVFAFGSEYAGIGSAWVATPQSAGVDLLPDLATATVDEIAGRVRRIKRPGDIAVASIHWGGNWGYEIPKRQRHFARGLIDRAGIDVVHGHSSHHVKGIEIHRERPIIYGCGDFISDYEGIRGHEKYRSDIGLMYFPTLDAKTGRLLEFNVTPTRVRKFRIGQAPAREAAWLAEVLNSEGRRLGTSVRPNEEGGMAVVWGRHR